MNALKLFVAAAPCALAIAFSPPAAAADSVTEERQVRGFKGLGLSVPGRVEVVQGEREGVTITARPETLRDIETRVEDGILEIRWKKERDRRHHEGRIRITLHARTLESIAIAGSGDVSAPALRSARMAVRIAGSGDLRLAGGAESLEVRISGSGDVDAAKFDTRRATVKIAGSGDARVWARDTLEVSVAGSGDVHYYGDPSIDRRIAGSGSVRRAGAAPG